MASQLDAKAPWTCDVCQKSMPRSKEICGVCRRGQRPKGNCYYYTQGIWSIGCL